jgi:hypothetical protein
MLSPLGETGAQRYHGDAATVLRLNDRTSLKWLISRGYEAASYIAFSGLHLVFAVAGVYLLRGELKERAAPVSVEFSRTVA